MSLSPRHRSRLVETGIFAGLALLSLLFWWRLWAPNPADRAAVPHGDLAGQYYPLQLLAAREMGAGHLPAWDPYLNGGQPGLADIQTGTFYPPNLIPNLIRTVLIRSSGGGWTLLFGLGWLHAQITFHFFLASLFTYLYVRQRAGYTGARLPAARFAGLVAALCFTYAGYLTSFPVQQLTILQTAVWLPAVLYCLDRAFRGQRPGQHVILAASALACALLAGHPQTAMYVIYAVVGYGLFQATAAQEDTGRALRFRQVALRFANYTLLPLLLGLALAIVQLAPSLAFIARSTRADLGYEAVSWGFPLAEITHLLYPGYFGGSPQYVGILPPILAAAALFVRRARRHVHFWVGAGIVALVLAFGGHTFLYSVAYLGLPGFGVVRNQERIIYLFSFAASVLAGYGALTLAQPLPPLARRGYARFRRGLGWLAIVFLALTALWYLGFLQGVQQGVEINMFEGVLRHHTLILLILGGSVALLALRSRCPAGRRGLMILTLALIWLNLFTVNGRYHVIDPALGGPTPSAAHGPFTKTGLVTFLQEQPGVHRISSSGLLPGGASAGVVFELEDTTGNTPLRLDSFQQFEMRIPSWRQWQLLNVHHALSERDLEGPGLAPVYAEGNVNVYRVVDALPRAWVVYQTITADDARALDLIGADDFDPLKAAIVPENGGLAPLSGIGEVRDAVGIVTAEPGRLVLDVSADARGLLVVSQPFYPGWRAWVDGQPVRIHKVDYLLQGVPLEPGSHRVELRYRLPLWPGAISVLVLVVCILALVVMERRA